MKKSYVGRYGRKTKEFKDYLEEETYRTSGFKPTEPQLFDKIAELASQKYFEEKKGKKNEGGFRML